MLLLLSADFFSKLSFSKNSFKLSNSLDPYQDQSVWVQTVDIVCNGYQQMTKVAARKERVE